MVGILVGKYFGTGRTDWCHGSIGGVAQYAIAIGKCPGDGRGDHVHGRGRRTLSRSGTGVTTIIIHTAAPATEGWKRGIVDFYGTDKIVSIYILGHLGRYGSHDRNRMVLALVKGLMKG